MPIIGSIGGGSAGGFGQRKGASGINAAFLVIAGGAGAVTAYNIIDYVTISTTGNATDFGDLLAIKSAFAGISNDHGGLQ